MPTEQIDLIKRTDEELRKSIAQKREKHGLNAELTPEETDLLLRQMKEERADRNNAYPH